MRRLATIGALVLALPSLAFAHVSVRPRESKPGVEEKYTVRVPTEGTVATTHVLLEIPAGVMVLEVLPPDGATFETSNQGDRVTGITWKKAASWGGQVWRLTLLTQESSGSSAGSSVRSCCGPSSMPCRG